MIIMIGNYHCFANLYSIFDKYRIFYQKEKPYIGLFLFYQSAAICSIFALTLSNCAANSASFAFSPSTTAAGALDTKPSFASLFAI